MAQWGVVDDFDSLVDVHQPRNSAIPKLLHFVWVGSNPSEQLCSRIDDWANLNPQCRVVLWDDRAISRFIEWSGPRGASASLPSLIEASANHAVTSDVVRFAVLDAFGGIYLDADMEAVRPITRLFEEPSGFVVRESRWLLVAAAIGFPPGSEFCKLALEVMAEEVERHTVLDNYMSGPPLVTELQGRLQSSNLPRPVTLEPWSFYPHNPFRFPRATKLTYPPYGVHLFAHSWAGGGEMSVLRRLVRLAQPVTPKDIAIGARRKTQLELRDLVATIISRHALSQSS